jgi:hypothetical protein
VSAVDASARRCFDCGSDGPPLDGVVFRVRLGRVVASLCETHAWIRLAQLPKPYGWLGVVQCEHCGWSVSRCQNLAPGGAYCSDACTRAASDARRHERRRRSRVREARQCDRCAAGYTPKVPWQRFCGDACRKRAWSHRVAAPVAALEVLPAVPIVEHVLGAVHRPDPCTCPRPLVDRDAFEDGLDRCFRCTRIILDRPAMAAGGDRDVAVAA